MLPGRSLRNSHNERSEPRASDTESCDPHRSARLRPHIRTAAALSACDPHNSRSHSQTPEQPAVRSTCAPHSTRSHSQTPEQPAVRSTCGSVGSQNRHPCLRTAGRRSPPHQPTPRNRPDAAIPAPACSEAHLAIFFKNYLKIINNIFLLLRILIIFVVDLSKQRNE